MSISEAVKNSGFDDHASGAPNNRTFLLKGCTLYTGLFVYSPDGSFFKDIKKLKTFPCIGDYEAINTFMQKVRGRG